MTNEKDCAVFAIGEIVFDIYPDEKFIGGAPFNFIYHLTQLGISSRFVSRIGEDELGSEFLDFAKSKNIPWEEIQRDPEKQTGEVQVFLNMQGTPRFEILKDQAFDYLEDGPKLNFDADSFPSFAYFGTLAQRNSISENTIQETMTRLKNNSKIFLDINLRSPFYNYEIIDASLKNCDILKANEEELAELKRMLGLEYYPGENYLIDHFHKEYGIQSIFVTRGKNGADLYKPEDSPLPIKYHPSFSPKIEDTLGAGDAFSAKLIFELIQEKSEEEAMGLATDFASKICEIKGALPKEKSFYEI
jgi:fructokinase